MIFDTVLIVIRLMLAATFAVAAVAKLADLAGSRQAMQDFGVPGSLVRPTAILLPVAEGLAAALLLAGATASVGAVLTLVLVGTFAVGISGALRRGQAPQCHCFGQLHSRPAGRNTLVRNGGLMGLAAFVLAGGGGPSLGDWLAHDTDVELAFGLALLAALALSMLAFTLWEQLHSEQPFAADSQPAAVGSSVPTFVLPTSAGGTLRSEELSAGKRSLLVFTSATCAPCHAAMPEFARWRRMLAGRLDLHVIASGDSAVNARMAAQHDLPMVLDKAATVSTAMGVPATPSGVEINSRGLVSSPPVAGNAGIEALIRAVLRKPADEVGDDSELVIRHR